HAPPPLSAPIPRIRTWRRYAVRRTTPSRRTPHLIRRLGLVETTAVALGAMIGAGAYVAIAEAGSTTGRSLPIAVILGATVATFNGLSSVELGVDDPRAGGAYQFGR